MSPPSNPSLAFVIVPCRPCSAQHIVPPILCSKHIHVVPPPRRHERQNADAMSTLQPISTSPTHARIAWLAQTPPLHQCTLGEQSGCSVCRSARMHACMTQAPCPTCNVVDVCADGCVQPVCRQRQRHARQHGGQGGTACCRRAAQGVSNEPSSPPYPCPHSIALVGGAAITFALLQPAHLAAFAVCIACAGRAPGHAQLLDATDCTALHCTAVVLKLWLISRARQPQTLRAAIISDDRDDDGTQH